MSKSIIGQTAPDFTLQADDGTMFRQHIIARYMESHISIQDTILRPAKEDALNFKEQPRTFSNPLVVK